jgi:hypothetical protein
LAVYAVLAAKMVPLEARLGRLRNRPADPWMLGTYRGGFLQHLSEDRIVREPLGRAGLLAGQ